MVYNINVVKYNMEDLMSTTEETIETTTETTEVKETPVGVGGIVGETHVTSLDGLISVILQERLTLVRSNKNNTELFNKLQEFITEKSNNVTQVDGAISALNGFVTEDTPSDDKHVVELAKLHHQRNDLIGELKTADAQRRNIFSTITMTEGALQVLNQVLSKTDHTEEGTTEATEV